MKTILHGLLGMLVLSVGAAAQSTGGGRLVGSWDAVVTPRVCATGDAITTFNSVYNFNEGGTFTGRSSGTGSGGNGRDQLGVWNLVEGNHYRSRFTAYLFNAAGQVTGYQVLTNNIELNQDASGWSATGISQTFNFDDVQTAAGCSTTVGTRVTLDETRK